MLGLLMMLLAHDPAAHGTAAAPRAACALTAEDKAANRRLSFREFDQLPTLPSNARSLGAAGCYREAAEATEDYLAHGPLAEPGQRAIMAFHMAQYLASAGDEREAARVVTLGRRADLPPAYHIDWNSYVDGVRAFLVKDRPALVETTARLRARKTAGDDMNAAALERLGRCFERPYKDVWTSDACAPPKPETP
ncbi:hypothetical protein [Caulobacter mirabilis]|uniref:Uncharacterized protein n=1 Tax=Caulobacter mirabilis TaxID=69666 RepID=A0A2D2AUE5_9CAUL|nr:hypothetical protein [Caulobacter mirabilis]ATQ41642.1 hypothetical protein CSW64_04045 [Caulobacter mirabilis]